MVLEKVGWFAIVYAWICLTATVVMLVIANKAFKLGGPIGMARGAFLLVLVLMGFMVWVGKAASPHADGSANDQIKQTIRKTSSWMGRLKEEASSAEFVGEFRLG